MKVAITGPTGAMAAQLIPRLEAGGNEVLRVTRGPSTSADSVWEPSTGWIRDGALDGCDAVVHLAGANIGEGRWTSKRKALLRSSRIDSAKLLIDHIRGLANPPKTFVSASAVGIYGNRPGEELTEESSRGGGFLADLVADWEAAADEAASAGMRVVKLRFAPVLDPDSGMLQKMLMTVKFGFGVRMGNGKQYVPWVSPTDAVRAVEFALTNEIEGAFNVCAPEQVTNAELTKTLGRVKGRPLVLPGPAFAMKLAVGGAAEELMLYTQRVKPAALPEAGFTFDDAELEPLLQTLLRKSSE